jgi:hypothetical protein
MTCCSSPNLEFVDDSNSSMFDVRIICKSCGFSVNVSDALEEHHSSLLLTFSQSGG